MFRILINTLLIIIFSCWPALAQDYTGSAWRSDSCYWFTGTTWKPCFKKRYNGTSWIATDKPSISYLLTETFENSEFDLYACGAVIPCVTDGGARSDGDFPTTGLDMVGNYCLRLSTTGLVVLQHAPIAIYYVYYLFLWRYNDNIDDAEEPIASIMTTSSTYVGHIYATQSTGTAKFEAIASGGTFSAQTTTGHAPNVSRWLKVRAKQGSGSNTEVCVSPWQGSSWETWRCSTNGTTTANPSIIRFRNYQDEETEYQYVDNVRVSMSDFTLSPTNYQ